MKNLFRASPKQALGVMVDGRDLKIAHLGWDGGELVIYALESVTLQRRLGKISKAKTTTPMAYETENKDVFGLEEQESAVEGFAESETDDGDVSSILINVFSKFPLKSTGLAINIPEGHTTYYNFDNDFGLKKETHLLKRLREEIRPLAGVSLDAAMLDYFRSESGGLTAIVSEGNVPLIEELQDIKVFLPRNTPFYSLIGSNELALVNLVRQNFDLPSTQTSAIIFIGCDFSRVIILKGNHPISFVQSVREGYQSPQICNTLFSKILLEQEEAGLPEIDQIFLAGEIGLTRAHDFFSRQFPDAKVQSLTPGPLNTHLLKAEEIAIFPNFAIPVSLAWEALDPQNPNFIRANLIPTSIREAQKFFKIAWHGFVLLGVVFAGMVLISYQGISRHNTIKSLENSIRHKQASLEALQPQIALVNQLQEAIGVYRSNLDFLDSLIVDPGKWSRLFSKLSQDFEQVDKIWIEDIKSDPQGFTMIGKALYRDRIPIIAAGFDSTDLKRVTRVVSEDGETSYEFEFLAKLPPPKAEDFIESKTDATSQNITATENTITAEPEPGVDLSTLVAASPVEPTITQPEVLPPSPQYTELAGPPLLEETEVEAPKEPAFTPPAVPPPNPAYSEPAGPSLLEETEVEAPVEPTITQPAVPPSIQQYSEPAGPSLLEETEVEAPVEPTITQPAVPPSIQQYSEPAGPPLLKETEVEAPVEPTFTQPAVPPSIQQYSEPAGPPLLKETEVEAPVEPTFTQPAVPPPNPPYSEPAGPFLLKEVEVNSPAEPTTTENIPTEVQPLTRAIESEASASPSVESSSSATPLSVAGRYSEPAGPPAPPVVSSTPPLHESAQTTGETPVMATTGAMDLYDIGIRLVRSGSGAKASKIFQSLINTYPEAREIPAAHYWLGECYFEEHNYSAAARCFQASLRQKRNSKRQAGLLMLGQTYMRLGRAIEARVQFETLLREVPRSEYTPRAQGYLQQLTTEE